MIHSHRLQELKSLSFGLFLRRVQHVDVGPGDSVVLHAPKKTERLEIVDVRYERIPMDPYREPPGAESAGRPGCSPATAGDWPKIFAGPHRGPAPGAYPDAVYECNFVPNLLVAEWLIRARLRGHRAILFFPSFPS